MRKVALLLLLLVSSCGYGATYYLSANGNDQASGTTPSTAWQTLGRLDSAKLGVGDQIYLRGGDTFAGTLYVTKNLLTIGSYGNGQATIDAGSGDGIDIYDVAGTSITNLEIEGGWKSATQTGNAGSGISAFCDIHAARKLRGFKISDVTVHGFMQCGIVLGAYPSDGSQSGFSDVEISQCRVYSNGQAGIESYGYFDPNATTYAHSGVLVEFCTVYDNEGLVDGSYASGNGIVLGQVEDATIQYCEAYGNGALNGYPTAGPVGIWAWDSNHVTIQHCESHHNQTQTYDGDGFDFDGGVINSVMQYNYSHDNYGAGLLIAEYAGAKPQYNITLRYNISQNDGTKVGGGIVLWSASTPDHDCLIYNNTIFTTTATPAVNLSNPVQNIVFRNNVIASRNSPLVQAPSGQSNVIFQANDYWGLGGDFAISWEGSNVTSIEDWRALGQETMGTAALGFWAGPAYLSFGDGQTLGTPILFRRLLAYRLKPTSPLVGAGVPMSDFGVNAGCYDFFGTPLRPGSPDIGATQTPLVAPYRLSTNSPGPAAHSSLVSAL